VSAIGFQPSTDELERLREAYSSLNDVTRNLASAQRCIKAQDQRMAEHHLRAAEWHAAQAKKTIAEVGKLKKTKGAPAEHGKSDQKRS
jgi:hypothetical protein